MKLQYIKYIIHIFNILNNNETSLNRVLIKQKHQASFYLPILFKWLSFTFCEGGFCVATAGLDSTAVSIFVDLIL